MINLINGKHLVFHFRLVKISVYFLRLFHYYSFIYLAIGYDNWTLAIQDWADEKKDFLYGSKIQHGIVGHYTQVYCSYFECVFIILLNRW